MGTPSPELKQLWIRVLKRVHPDLAIDEQDRVRCERLTKLANAAYQAGDEEALRAVLRPSQPANARAPRAYTGPRQGQKVAPPPPAEPRMQQASPAPNRSPKRSFKSWFWLSNFPPLTAFSFKQLLPVAIAVVILIWGGFSLYSVTTSRHAVTNSPTTQAHSVKAPIQAHLEVTDAGISKVIWRTDSKPGLPEPESVHGSRHNCSSVTPELSCESLHVYDKRASGGKSIN